MQDDAKVPLASEKQNAMPADDGGPVGGSIFSQPFPVMAFSSNTSAPKEKGVPNSENPNLETKESQPNASNAEDEKNEE